MPWHHLLVCFILCPSVVVVGQECEDRFGVEIKSVTPVRSCHCGSAWKFWRVLETNTVEIHGPLSYARVAKLASADSSLLTTASLMIKQAWSTFALRHSSIGNNAELSKNLTERWQGNVCSQRRNDECAIEFSPYGTSCIEIDTIVPTNSEFRIVWHRNLTSRKKRSIVIVLCTLLFMFSDWFSEATSLQYGVGVVAGVLASVLILFAFVLHACGGLSGRSHAARFRLAALAAFGFGYVQLVSTYITSSLTRILTDWPLACAFYLCFSTSASIAGTRAILRTGLVPDFVRAAARLSALLLALIASASATVTFIFIFILLLSDNLSTIRFYLSSSSLVEEDDLDEQHHHTLSFSRRRYFILLLASILSITPLFIAFSFKTAITLTFCIFASTFLLIIFRRLPFLPRNFSTTNFDSNQSDSNPPPIFLHGHRFLSQAEYEEQTRSTTEAALKDLFQDPAYAAWLTQNHNRLSRTPPSTNTYTLSGARRRRRTSSTSRSYNKTPHHYDVSSSDSAKDLLDEDDDDDDL
mmetsp:Transcript_21537/g.33028  ORF Transcript_21537/g.33028 Transcript_21537/m.33028 type:complete len:525 (-) Transcript_21537:71-1645(-)